MTLSSAFSGRRSRGRRAEATQQILVFPLRQERFALPIQLVQKVILVNHVYGATSEGSNGFTLYKNQEIPILDLEHRIFRTSSAPQAVALPSQRTDSQAVEPLPRYLLIVPNLQGEAVGLPVSSRPSLQRVPVSTFSPLSATYLAEGTIQCVKALITLPPDEPPIFLLDLNQFFYASILALPEHQ